MSWFEYPEYREYLQLHPPYEAQVSVLDLLFSTGGQAHEFLRLRNGSARLRRDVRRSERGRDLFDSATSPVGSGPTCDEDTPHTAVAFTVHRGYIDSDEQWRACRWSRSRRSPSRTRPTRYSMFVGAGYRNRNELRELVCGWCRDAGYELITVISSGATYLGEPPGDNIGSSPRRAVVQPFASVGSGTVIGGLHHGRPPRLRRRLLLPRAPRDDDGALSGRATIASSAAGPGSEARSGSRTAR